MRHFVPGPDPEVREFVPEDGPGVQALLVASEDYFIAATGDVAAPGDMQSLFYALPEGAEPEAKRLFVVIRDGLVIGLVDVVIDHPGPNAAAVGLFLVHPDYRRLGVGDVVARALIQHARESGIRLVTVTTPLGWTPGLAFLDYLGFAVEAPEDAYHQSSNRNLGPREVIVRRGSLRLGS